MFYPEEMSQVRMIIPSKDLLAVTRQLADEGVLHQVEAKLPTGENLPQVENTWPEQAEDYSNLERKILNLVTILKVPLREPATKARWEEFADLKQAQQLVDQIDQQVKQAREKIADEEKQVEQLENILNQLEPISGIHADLESLRNPRYIHSILGVIPVANIDRLQTSLEKVPALFMVLREEGQKAVVWLTGPQRDADILDRAARSAYLNPLSLPETYQGTPADVIARVQADIANSQQEITRQRNILKQIAQDQKTQLQELLAKASSSRVLAQAIGMFGRFHYTYVITGWVPTQDINKLAANLRKVTPDILMESLPYKRGPHEQDVPVALSNPGLIRAFQGFVTNYGQPRYQELDPTFLLAIAFPLIFGAMFGDVGQGLILIVLGELTASRKIKALSPLAGIGRVVSACGLSAAIFGILYGSIFGFENIIPSLFIRPMENILGIMGFAIGMGVVLLSIGFLINIINSYTSRDWGQFLVEPHSIAGLLMYLSLVGLALEVIIGQHPIPLVVFGILALVAGLMVMFSEAIKHLIEGHRPLVEGGFAIYVFRAFFELFETLISLLSNSISFVRVGAFALAHVGLTEVFFVLAVLISPHHGIGYWIMVVFANIFLIGFEGIIVGIQTMRLSYYEFFSKFFAGGGIPYEPLTLRPRPEE